MRKNSKCISKRHHKNKFKRKIATSPEAGKIGTLLLTADKWWSKHYIFAILKKIKFFNAKMEGMRFIK